MAIADLVKTTLGPKGMVRTKFWIMYFVDIEKSKDCGSFEVLTDTKFCFKICRIKFCNQQAEDTALQLPMMGQQF